MMSRRTRRRRAAMRQALELGTLSPEVRQEVFDDAYSQGFDKGYQKAQEALLKERAQFEVDIERRAMEKARQKPFMVLAHRNGYNEGYEVGYGEGFQKGQLAVPQNHFSYQDLDRARKRGFDDGYQAGCAATSNAGNEKATRNTVLDEVLQECEVIAQSNPNMAPGVNAVRHRVKKLRK